MEDLPAEVAIEKSRKEPKERAVQGKRRESVHVWLDLGVFKGQLVIRVTETQQVGVGMVSGLRYQREPGAQAMPGLTGQCQANGLF